MNASHLPIHDDDTTTHQTANPQTDWLIPETRIVSAQAISGYSRIVGSLKLLLPICGACILLIIMVLPNINGSNAEPKKLTALDAAMVAPVFTSRDAQNRPYEITADTARQKPGAQGITDLTNPKAVIDLENGKKLNAEANGALYNQNDGSLNVQKGLTLRNSDGTTFTTQEAHVDMNGKNAEGTKPVLLQGQFGEVRGEGFKALEGGKTIIFTGQSSATLKLGSGQSGTKTPIIAPQTAPAEPNKDSLPSPPDTVQNMQMPVVVAPAPQATPQPTVAVTKKAVVKKTLVKKAAAKAKHTKTKRKTVPKTSHKRVRKR